MFKRKSLSVWSVLGIILLVLIAVAAIFCVVVLIAGSCNDLGFVDQLTKWFAPDKFAKMVEQTEEVVSTTAHILGM